MDFGSLVAAEGAVPQSFAEDGRSDGHDAPAERLGEHERVGLDPEPLVEEELPRPPHPGLHLVEDEQGAVGAAGGAHGSQVVRARQPPARLHLHRLEQDRSHIASGQTRLERLDLGKG